ncbi:hypothetical protein [Actinomadura violacea]|uniref:Uncharacterized protein n=1 Tax=Actinomadura violacea TaxID=2819934 RepID=A0ABS3S7K1_9ACTN|nr:hypothetical protein [Actinomadura violacea]MBO2464986.1 hypothetical protein [Actinomadura violacea]
MSAAPHPADVALALDADMAETAGVLVARRFTACETPATLALAADRGEEMLSETEPLEATLPHPDDVQVASRWPAVNAFRAAYVRAMTAPNSDREDAEADSLRWEQAAVRVAPAAAERVPLSAEVWLLRRAREVERQDADWWG